MSASARERACTELQRKVAALRDPRSYPGGTGAVDAVETHMSWVFLTRDHAWKLKKPVRLEEQDFRSLQARRFYCEEELRLNRRLAPGVYLGVVALRAAPDGTLHVGGEGEVQDWLVQMRRLPAAPMLDSLLAAGAATPSHMRAVAARLCDFYRGLPPAPMGAAALRAKLLEHLEDAEHDLSRPRAKLPPGVTRAVCEALRAFVRASPALFDRRVAQGRVVEGHGDLRPEHVWLGEPLAIIDCLEFSPRLRMQDAADEIGFLALECERAGAPHLGAALVDAYGEGSGDRIPVQLLHFYQACRACVRGRLAVRHLADPCADAAKWRGRARQYLQLAARHQRAADRAVRAVPMDIAAGAG